MMSKKCIPILLLSLVLVLAGSFAVFADEADEAAAAESVTDEAVPEDTAETEAEGSSVIVTNNIMQMWEQEGNDMASGPSLIAALIGQASADPDAPGIASAVIGRWENGEVDLPSNDEDTTDYALNYYLALLAEIQAQTEAQAAQAGAAQLAAVDTTPVTDASGRELIPLGTFAVTKYCACSICSGGSGLTASGKRPRANHTIAADTRLYPFGTQLMINGIIYTVEDTGGSVKGNTVDIYVDNHSEAVSYGTHYADVYLVK